MHVREDGPATAATVLLLHGFSSSSRSLDAVTALLADRFHVVRVDLLGHGRTGGAAADAPAQAAAVAAVLDELRRDDVLAVGHSFGADVAVELAATSGRVTRVVVVAQAPDYSDATLPRAGRLLSGRGALAYTAARPVLHLAARGLGPVHAGAAGTVRDLGRMDAAMFRTVLVQRGERMARRPLDAVLAESGAPALVVLGGRDGFYGARSADRYRAAGARVEVVADAGHDLPRTHPAVLAELVAEAAQA